MRTRSTVRRAVALSSLALACARAPQRVAPASSSLSDSLLALMTLEEKLGQLTMASGEGDQIGPRVPAGGEDDVRAGRVGSFLNLWGSDTARRLQRIAIEESRLRIPLLFAQDVLHGWRTIFSPTTPPRRSAPGSAPGAPRTP
jgi:beta-glucosidase